MLEYILLLCITPFLIMCGGLVLVIYPPRNINDRIGYKSKKAKSSLLHWEYAQKISGTYMVLLGLLWLVVGGISVSYIYPLPYAWYFLLGIILLEILTFLLVIPLTENKLKDFNKKEAFLKKVDKEDIIDHEDLQ